jgi:hypothetical protein
MGVPTMIHRYYREQTSSHRRESRRQRRLAFERLESRELLSALPLWSQATAAAIVGPVTAAKAATLATAKAIPTPPKASATSTPSPAPASAASKTTSVVAALSPTQQYIENFNPAYYIQQGTDYTNFAYTPAGAAQRLGKPVSQINVVYDYDFAKLAAVTNELAGVDRLTALQAIFAKITAGAATDEAKQLAVLRFLQEAHIHNGILQPMYPNGTMVTDPLVLLQLGEMRCGQVARVAVDLFSAVGYQARLVQLGGHVIAEIYYGQNWHYFDADLFGGGECVFNPDGSIPSVVQLSQSPYLIDSLPADWEPNCYNSAPTSAEIAPSYYYFSLQAWDAQFTGKAPAPYVIYKTATAAQAQNSIYYGWNYYTEVSTPNRQLYNMPIYYTPGAPQIQSVQTQIQANGSWNVTIGWSESPDPNGSVSYSIFVSNTSRGWNYDGESLPGDLMALKSSNVPWNPSMYAARYTLPKSEVFFGKTTATSETLTFTRPGKYFITIMAQDAHGASVGRILFPESEELCITV